MFNREKLFCFTILLVSSCVLSGCVNKVDDSVSLEQIVPQIVTETITRSNAASINEDFVKIANMGIDTTAVRDFGEYYIAEDKFYIPKEDLSFMSIDIMRSLTHNGSMNAHKYKLYYYIIVDNNTDALLAEYGISMWQDIPWCGLDVEYGTDYMPNKLIVEFRVRTDMPSDVPLLTFKPTSDGFPYTEVNINLNSSLWVYVKENNTNTSNVFINLVAHAVGESLGISSIMDRESNPGSIMIDESLLAVEPSFLWCGLTAQDEIDIATLFPATQHQFTYQCNPSVEKFDNHFVLNAGEMYTFTISSSAECCQNSGGVVYHVDVESVNHSNTSYDIVDINSKRGQFGFCFSDSGEYIVRVWVEDHNIAGSNKFHEQSFLVYVLEDKLEFTPSKNIALNIPYSIEYKYWHPEHPNATIHYEAVELLFEHGNSDKIELAPTNEGCLATLRANGSYFITCEAKTGEIVHARKFCNITRMPLPDSLIMERTQTINDGMIASFAYIPPHATVYDYKVSFPDYYVNERVCYLVEAEIEHQYSRFCPPNPVEKNRIFNLDYCVFKKQYIADDESYYLPRMGWWMVSQEDELNFEGYLQYYTGYIYAYSTGIKEVEEVSMDCITVRELRDPQIEGHTPDIMRSRKPWYDVEK